MALTHAGAATGNLVTYRKEEGVAMIGRDRGLQEVTTSLAGFVTTDNLSPLRLGAIQRATPASFWEGDLAELIIYRGAHAVADMKTVEGYLAAKFGITLQ